MGLGIGLGSGFDYFRQYNVSRRIGIRRNGAEPQNVVLSTLLLEKPICRPTATGNEISVLIHDAVMQKLQCAEWNRMFIAERNVQENVLDVFFPFFAP